MHALIVVAIIYLTISVFFWVGIYIQSRFYISRMASTDMYRSQPLLYLLLALCIGWSVYYSIEPFLYTYFGHFAYTCDISNAMVLASVTTTFFMHVMRTLDFYILTRIYKSDHWNIVSLKLKNKRQLLMWLAKKMRSYWVILSCHFVCSIASLLLLWNIQYGMAWSNIEVSSNLCPNPATHVTIASKVTAITVVALGAILLWFQKFGGAYKEEILLCMLSCAVAVSSWLLLTIYINRLAGSFLYAILCKIWIYLGWVYFPFRVQRVSERNNNKIYPSSLTLDMIWNDPVMLEKWKLFCQKNLCLESTLAYEALRNWKLQKKDEHIVLFRDFYEKFIHRSAFHLINIDHGLFQKWDSLIIHFDTKLFEQIVDQTLAALYTLMTMDLLPRFLRTIVKMPENPVILL